VARRAPSQSDTPSETEKQTWTLFRGRLDAIANSEELPAQTGTHIAPVLTMPSRDVVLFASLSAKGQRPTSIVGSFLIHALAGALVWFGFGYRPPIARVVTDHMMVRELDLLAPIEAPPPAAAKIPYPKGQKHAVAAAHGGQSEPAPLRPPMTTQVKEGPQTLIQADLLNPTKQTLHIPVPQVVIWSPPKTPTKTITPPLPQKPTSADVHPNLARPNQEINLADVNIASSNLPSVKMQLAPSTTSPVAVHTPSQAQLPPVSATQSTAQPTPAAILSVSDFRLKDGTAALPPVNEVQKQNGPGGLTTGQGQSPSAQTGKGAPSNKPGESGAGQNAEAGGNHPGPASGSGAAKPDAASTSAGPVAPEDAAGRFSTTTIALPKDGHFGAVLFGESINQKFPEAAEAWNGRMAYTAYLHVGLQKSWIMQYSLPRNAEAAAGGNISHLDAPWPYNIVRPNIEAGSIGADALMVHGFVNESGRFEDMTVVFTDSYSGAQFVLNALKQWQFRPATQSGNASRVEVLLIIPEVE
jgi:hypothetical protein